jgi:hypothetical protein
MLGSGLLVLLATWLMSATTVLAAQPPAETEVKAVYVYNFASFVSWPADSTAAVNSPFQICALGENPVTELLTQVVEGEKVQGRPMEFRFIESSADATPCQILFLATSDQLLIAHTLQAVQTLPVLTVGEQAGFAQHGGHIELSLRGSRIHPIINRQSVDRSKLRISAKLYRLATVLDELEPSKP